MASLTVNTPDGAELNVDIPEGTPESAYPQMAQEAITHYSSLPGKAEAFGRAAVNNLPLGGQIGAVGTSMVNPDEDYSQAMKDWNVKAAESKEAHPIAYGAGATAGTLAPLVIPGVGEAMEAAPVATGAALGAANAVGNTDIVQNPGEALKQGAEGAAIGGVLGKIMPTGKGAAEGMEEFANKKTVQSMGLPPGLLNVPKEEIQELGDSIHTMGLDKGSTEDKFNLANAKLQEVGNQIGAKGLNASTLRDASPFVQKLHEELQNSASIFGPDANPEATIYRQAIANLQNPNLTFDALQKLKSMYGDRAFDALGNVRNDAAANVYGQIKDAMKSIVDSSGEYQDLMDQYGTLKDLTGALGKKRGIENANGVQAKGFGLAGKMGGMVTGGNIPATVGLAGAIAPAHPFMGLGLMTTIFNNPQAMSTLARTASEVAPKAAAGATLGSINAVTSTLVDKIQNNPKSLGKFAKPLMQSAQTGGAQGLAATHYLLSSQYPEYNEMMMQGSNPLRPSTDEGTK